MSYLASDKALARAPWLAPLGSRSGRATSHVLRGTYRGHQVLLLTLSSKRSTPGPEGTTQVDKREQGIYTIQLPGILPRIEVRPRYSVGDLARAVRDRDEAVARGDFEGAYELQTDDAAAGRAHHAPAAAGVAARDERARLHHRRGPVALRRRPDGRWPDRVLARLSLRAARADPAERVERAWRRTGLAPAVVVEETYRGGAHGPGSTGLE